MLSLYDKNFKQPELLPKYHKLFIEKMQCPLALLPPTTEEESVSLRLFMLPPPQTLYLRVNPSLNYAFHQNSLV